MSVIGQPAAPSRVDQRVAAHSRRVTRARHWRPAAGAADLYAAKRALPALTADQRADIVSVHISRTSPSSVLFALGSGIDVLASAKTAANRGGATGSATRRIQTRVLPASAVQTR